MKGIILSYLVPSIDKSKTEVGNIINDFYIRRPRWVLTTQEIYVTLLLF